MKLSNRENSERQTGKDNHITEKNTTALRFRYC